MKNAKKPNRCMHTAAGVKCRIAPSSALVGSMAMLVIALSTHADPVEWSVASGGNGHFYELISASVDWNAARAAAKARTYAGLPGYLVTITSYQENQFLLSAFDAQTDSYAWIGGTDSAEEGVWRWADGPEAGIQFAQGHSATAPFNYANWSAVEPNNSGGAENWAVLQLGNSATVANGQWGDDPLGGAGQVGVYIVEYSVVPKLPWLSITPGTNTFWVVVR